MAWPEGVPRPAATRAKIAESHRSREPRMATCHPEQRHKGLGLCSSCWQKDYRRRNPERAQAWERSKYARTAEQQIARSKTRNQFLKAEIIAAYGRVCACCGETEMAFLSIDHINRDGHVHRKRVGPGGAVWADLRKRGYPQEGYRVLCMNCQWGYRIHGLCPHQQAKTEVA